MQIVLRLLLKICLNIKPRRMFCAICRICHALYNFLMIIIGPNNVSHVLKRLKILIVAEIFTGRRNLCNRFHL